MSEELFPYYERELLFIRQFAQEFAKLYPAAAGRLLLEPNRSTDPHIERLIEAFALIAGRIHYKIDDEFPELTHGLLSVLYPHYLAPIPSMSIVGFDLDAARTQLPNGFLIDRGSRLQSPPIKDIPCKFRTAYPVTLWPIVVTGAELSPPPYAPDLRPPPRTAAILTLKLECQGGQKFADLSLDRLRFFIDGDSQTSASIYELLFNHVLQVQFRSPAGPAPATGRAAAAEPARDPITLPPEQVLSQVGFERDEALLPYPKRSFLGYRLLTEFFAYPSKFWFFDLAGFRRICKAGWQRKCEVVLFLDRYIPSLRQAVTLDTFRLGCTPIVNLFEQTAEPIPLTQEKYEYRIVPDVARVDGMEVYSVDSVTSLDPVTGRATEYQPFYSLRHGEDGQTFWHTTRRRSPREGDRGTDVFLNVVDLGFHPSGPAEATLLVRTTCTNRDLPAQLQRFGNALTFVLEAAAPLSGVRCLRPPTPALRPPLRRGAYWRLVSHLNLNHFSLTEPEQGREALQEILRLYDFSDAEAKQQSAIARNLIDGIVSVESRRVVGRRSAASGIPGFCQGVEVTIDFDEQKYLGTGVILFASVLERFLSLYVNINSFTQLVARVKGEGGSKKWPPRAGEQAVL